MTAQVSKGGVEIAGTLKRLPSLPNAAHQRLFNAENCTVSANGRAFITGSTAAYEILPAQGHADPYEYREIPIIVDEVPKDCFRNGISTFRDHLYLACAHIRLWEKSAFPDWRPALNAISQTRPLNLTWLWLAEVFERVDSYILRADLRKDPVRFDECLKIPDNCFANGLAADHNGNLYLANSIPGSSCIYKIDWHQSPPQHSVWFKTLTRQLINGLKCKGDSVYYTCMPLPMWATLERIEVRNGTAGEPATTYSTAGFFDDFDTCGNGIILTNGSDIPSFTDIGHLRRGMANGSLIFISNSGGSIGVFKDEELVHPSSVKLVDYESKLFAKGDVIVTDKGVDGEYAAFIFTPDDTCRSWFLNG